MSHIIRQAAWLAALLVAAGCNSSTDSSDTAGMSMDEMAQMLDQPKETAKPEPVAKQEPEPEATAPEPEKRNVQDVDTSNPSGSYYGAIIGANRSIRTRMDSLAWQQSVNFYRASNGYLPRNTEEFMRLMQSDGIPLPEIEPGHEYEYDPSEGQFGTLYDITPAQQPAPEQDEAPAQ